MRVPSYLSIKIITLLLLFIHLHLINVYAITYAVGVKVGDWAEYSFMIEWSSSPPQTVIPQMVKEARNIDYIKVEVKEVSVTAIKVIEEIYFKNNSKKTNFYAGDVRTGQGNLSIQIIAAKLNKGDRIYDDPEAPVINASGFKNYAGATRMVNKLRLESFLGENWTITDFYWDRDTGFLCEMAVLSFISTNAYDSTTLMKWEIIKTNLWAPPDLYLVGIGVGVLVVAGGCILYYLKPKRNFKKRHKRLKRLRVSSSTNTSKKKSCQLGPLQRFQLSI